VFTPHRTRERIAFFRARREALRHGDVRGNGLTLSSDAGAQDICQLEEDPIPTMDSRT
jgi:hypothetical protein